MSFDLNGYGVAKAAALLLVASTQMGCLLAIAGVVEGSKDDKLQDPFGTEYDSPDGKVGWAQDKGTLELKNLAWAADQAGCQRAKAPRGFQATCKPGGPVLYGDHSQTHLYRMCAPGTDRMACRSSWERLQKVLDPYLQPVEES
jgi:hypothetical protein